MPYCSGLMTPNTLIRDNIYQLLRCRNGAEKTNKKYIKEFKEEAVALVRGQGYSVSEASVLLGIASNMLYRWKVKLHRTRKANHC
jgi:transposase-like protein